LAKLKKVAAYVEAGKLEKCKKSLQKPAVKAIPKIAKYISLLILIGCFLLFFSNMILLMLTGMEKFERAISSLTEWMGGQMWWVLLSIFVGAAGIAKTIVARFGGESKHSSENETDSVPVPDEKEKK
jgi:TRAP-type C4-dicarboxylate transport system permease small subunit